MNDYTGQNASEENWEILQTLFPSNWQGLAQATSASTRLRGFKAIEDVLRILLLHVGKGYSLRETVALAKVAGIADISDVALLKRLRNSEQWLRELCLGLLKKGKFRVPKTAHNFSIRLVDGTVVKEPGKTGSLWRLLYSFELPRFECDYFRLTPTNGEGNGESFTYLPVASGDYVIGDRGYCTIGGIEHVAKAKAYTLVRVNPVSLPVFEGNSRKFSFLKKLFSLKSPHQCGSWDVLVKGESLTIPGRICAIRKSDCAIKLAEKRLRREASRDGRNLQPETIELAKYVIVFTTFPEQHFDANAILQWYRVRWQIELVFKRMKSLAQLGHLPKYDPQSSRAWLYGKLFIALLTQELIHYADSISPWGYEFFTKKQLA